MHALAVIGLLDTVTFPELMTVLLVGLVVLGPEKLPSMARQAGAWVNRFKAMSAKLQQEVTSTLDEEDLQHLKQIGEFAVNPRAKIADLARQAALESDPTPTATPEATPNSEADPTATEGPAAEDDPTTPTTDESESSPAAVSLDPADGDQPADSPPTLGPLLGPPAPERSEEPAS